MQYAVSEALAKESVDSEAFVDAARTHGFGMWKIDCRSAQLLHTYVSLIPHMDCILVNLNPTDIDHSVSMQTLSAVEATTVACLFSHSHVSILGTTSRVVSHAKCEHNSCWMKACRHHLFEIETCPFVTIGSCQSVLFVFKSVCWFSQCLWLC